jgi:hypothetical protein
MSRTGGYVRRTVVRCLVLAGVAVLGLIAATPLAGAAPLSGTPRTPYGPESPATASPTSAAPAAQTPSSATPTSASPSPTGSATPDRQSATASASPGRTTPPPAPSPTHTRIRLHTTVIGVQAVSAGLPRAHYTLRVGAAGGTARKVVAAISVRPRGTRFTGPRACTGQGTVHCRLGTVHGTRALRFHQRGHLSSSARLTLYVTASAANAPTERSTTVLVFRRTPPRTVHRSAPRYVQEPAVTRHDVVAVPEAPRATLAAPPPVRLVDPPAATGAAPAEGDMRGGPAAPAPERPQLPVIAPRPGPRPTPNGAPVTVRPVADGHQLTGDASGMPTRTIFGLLAAAASFVGLVTALVLVRRRNEQ